LASSGKKVLERSHASPYDLESTLYREIFEGMYKSVETIPYLWK